MTKEWNFAGTFLAILAIVIGFLWTFEVIEYERAIIALLIMIVFGLVYIGTQCMGVITEIIGLNKKNEY